MYEFWLSVEFGGPLPAPELSASVGLIKDTTAPNSSISTRWKYCSEISCFRTTVTFSAKSEITKRISLRASHGH